jgi:hypothetical protein
MSAMMPNPASRNGTSGSTHKKSSLNDSDIRELEKQLVAEREKTCSDADSAIEASQKIIERPKKDSRKFKVQTAQRKK